MNKIKKRLLALGMCCVLLMGSSIEMYAAELDTSSPIGYITLKNDKGVVYKMDLYPEKMTKSNVDEKSIVYVGSTDDMRLVSMARGSMTEDSWDSSTSIKFTMTINYDKKAPANGVETILLQSVSGSMQVNQSDLTISNQQVGAQCVNPVIGQSQQKWFSPTGRSFSYNTGFTTYVPTTGSVVGACWNGTISRGSTWRYETNLYYVI